ncbi:uncharacterized protein LOC128182970 [Crassostrea angulata]|uniref:uncharacterized protein LOC128182970 n=1 Tax=Magallana angulata TaxID=2784310 RepID=UPI0022B15A8D|nr:uncharacterized protein LOC128182970 [Crassostrea angulata]
MSLQNYVVVLLLCISTLHASSNCERFSEFHCREDCQWSKELNQCHDCLTGFYGTNCSRPCRYPNYGTNCQQDCSHCERLQCNATFGCLTTSTDAPFNQGSFGLDIVIIGFIASGFFVIFVSITCIFLGRRLKK